MESSTAAGCKLPTPMMLDSQNGQKSNLCHGSASHSDSVEGNSDASGNGTFTPASILTSPELEPSGAVLVRDSTGEYEEEDGAKWTEGEVEILELLKSSDLTLRTLRVKIPGKTIRSIRAKMKGYRGLHWTMGEAMVLIEGMFCESFSIKNYKAQFPLRSLQYLKNKYEQYKRTLKVLGVELHGNGEKSGWTASEIAIVVPLAHDCPTKSALTEKLMVKSIEDIRAFVSKIVPAKVTRSEIVLLLHLIQAGETVETMKEELLFRDLHMIQQIIVDHSNLKNLEGASKILDQISIFERKEIEVSKNSIDLEKLRTLIKKDPTRTTLQKNFPHLTIPIIKKIVIDEGFELNDSFTPGERKLLKHTTLNVNALIDEFPFRDIISVEKELIKYQPNTRRSKFANRVDELLYTANWYSSEIYERKSRIKDTNSNDEESLRFTRVKEVPDQVIDTKSKALKDLLLASRYFQSITGDSRIIDGRERRQIKPRSFTEENEIFTYDKKRKHSRTANDLRSESKKQKTVKRGKVGRPPKHIRKVDSKVSNKKRNSEKSEPCTILPFKSHNKFSPDGIMKDSSVPLHGRNLFVDDFYKDTIRIPELDFRNKSGCTLQHAAHHVLLEDGLAADIVSTFEKRYRDMPDSFPPLTITLPNTQEAVINPDNKIRIRYLLYPQHTERFILAIPKSNELDPIAEIKKIFQYHYALYFSHSQFMKRMILKDYCEKLDSAVQTNSFTEFLLVIDKWNHLMLELTPNQFLSSTDINQEVRRYIPADSKRSITAADLKLEMIYHEYGMTLVDAYQRIPPEYKTPHQEAVDFISDNNDKYTMNGTANEVEINDDSDHNMLLGLRNTLHVRSIIYINSFFHHLQRKRTISRFCMQLILLKVYSRIVSTDSRKLRYYKAFTAEVYGELLPSFISEVLTKVKFRPEQKFYDLGSGVGNTTFQAALEFGAKYSGGCEIMEHASNLTKLQIVLLKQYLKLLGLHEPFLKFALLQSFVENPEVKKEVLDCDVLVVNNYLFDANLNIAVGKLLYGLKPGAKIISLRNFIRPRYKVTGEATIFDYLKVEKFEMSYNSVSWTGNSVSYFVSTVQEDICPEFL